MSAALRCKMRVTRITHDIGVTGDVESEVVELSAVYSDNPESENAQWSRWTPSASLHIHINNPDAFGKVSKDAEYFVDLIPVEHVHPQGNS